MNLKSNLAVLLLRRLLFDYYDVFIVLVALIVLTPLYLTSYLLLHSLAEIFSVVVACGIFIIAWNSRKFLENHYLLFVGIAYFFMAIIDVFHAFYYKGMNIFPQDDINLPTQFWLAARYLQAISLLIAPIFFERKLKAYKTFWIFAVVTFLLILSINYWKIFPNAYIEGFGLTAFKIFSEYIISIILIGAIIFLLRKKEYINDQIRAQIIASLGLTIISELAFTSYFSVYSITNLIGHYFKIMAFFMMYKAVVENGLRKPYELFFKKLKAREEIISESEKKYRAIFENSGTAMMITDDDTTISLVNKEFEILTGYAKEETEGKLSWKRLFDSNELQIMEKNHELRRINSAGVSKRYETSILGKNGNRKNVILHIDLMFDEAKRSVVSFLDITARKKAEQSLRDSEEKYRMVANFTYNWEYWIGPDNKYLYISPSCEAITGYSANEFMQDFNLFSKIAHPDDRKILEDHFKSVLNEQMTENCHFDFRIITKEGVERWMNHQCRPVFRDDGTWLGRRGSNRNISARKRAEMAIEYHVNELENLTADLEKFRLAVENASDLIMIMDTEAEILFINKAAEKITGYSKSEIIGNTPALWSKGVGKKYYEKKIEEIMINKKSLTDEIINTKKNKEMYIAELRISPIFDDKGEVIYVVGIERDITRVKEMDQAKSEFISMASHQLRTPLTSINLATEMLLKDTAGNKEQQKYLKEIRDDITGMAALIASLLNVSRIELGTFLINLRPESIKDLATEVLKESYSQIKSKHIKIKKYFDSSLPEINIDRNMMKIIFQNLLSNAIKYTGEKGTITVEIMRQEKNALITVADNGRGIPEGQKGKVFTKMFRASNASEVEGVGIGLYIAKSLAVQSDCKIWFESEEGKGAKFYLLVPLNGMGKKDAN